MKNSITEGAYNAVDTQGSVIVEGNTAEEFVKKFHDELGRHFVSGGDESFEMGEYYEDGPSDSPFDFVVNMYVYTSDMGAYNQAIEDGDMVYDDGKMTYVWTETGFGDEGGEVNEYYDGSEDFNIGFYVGKENGGYDPNEYDYEIHTHLLDGPSDNMWLKWGECPELDIQTMEEGGYRMDMRPLIEKLKREFVSSGAFGTSFMYN